MASGLPFKKATAELPPQLLAAVRTKIKDLTVGFRLHAHLAASYELIRSLHFAWRNLMRECLVFACLAGLTSVSPGATTHNAG